MDHHLAKLVQVCPWIVEIDFDEAVTEHELCLYDVRPDPPSEFVARAVRTLLEAMRDADIEWLISWCQGNRWHPGGESLDGLERLEELYDDLNDWQESPHDEWDIIDALLADPDGLEPYLLEHRL